MSKEMEMPRTAGLGVGSIINGDGRRYVVKRVTKSSLIVVDFTVFRFLLAFATKPLGPLR